MCTETKYKRFKVKLNKSNYRRRIVALWIDQKEDEIIDFVLEDRETQEEFKKLVKSFDNK